MSKAYPNSILSWTLSYMFIMFIMFNLRSDLRYILSADLIFNYSWISAQDISIFKFESASVSRWLVRYAGRLESGSLLCLFLTLAVIYLLWNKRTMQNTLEILIDIQCLSESFPYWKASSQQLRGKKSTQKISKNCGICTQEITIRTEK